MMIIWLLGYPEVDSTAAAALHAALEVAQADLDEARGRFEHNL